MLVCMHSTVASELQVNAQITLLSTSIQLEDVDQSTVVGVILVLRTWVTWVLSIVCG